MCGEQERKPTTLNVHVSGNNGVFDISISVLDKDEVGLPDIPVRIMDKKADQSVQDLKTSEEGSLLFKLEFTEKQRFIIIHVPGSALVWKNVFYGS